MTVAERLTLSNEKTLQIFYSALRAIVRDLVGEWRFSSPREIAGGLVIHFRLGDPIMHGDYGVAHIARCLVQ